MKDSIEPIWLNAAETLVNKHKTAGHKIAVITATNRFVVEPIVRRLGIEELICSEPEIVAARYTGNFIGTPCFAEGKVVKISEWLKRKGLDLSDSWFYSDSHNDLPLLNKVSNPIAVDPDDKLQTTAKEKGWPIISLR